MITFEGENEKIQPFMSDGNFNRALLPSTPYRSGVKMGFQQARLKAKPLLQAILDHHCPALSLQEREAVVQDFLNQLQPN